MPTTSRAAINPVIDLIKAQLQRSPALKDAIPWNSWAADQTILGEKVKLFREYADGEHRAKLTKEMKNMLRIPLDDDSAPFSINHMDNLIQTVVDRIQMTGIAGSTPEATTWIDGIGTNNRMAALQLEVSESALRDGDTFVMAYWDNEAQEVRWSHEEAFDGVEGMIVIYGADKRAPAVAIKVWLEAINADKKLETRARINFYWPDVVAKFRQIDDHLEAIGAPEAYHENVGTALTGVPVVHFANQSKRYSAYGLSMLDSVVTVQDAINRTVLSMIAAAELTAFKIRYLFGMKAPTALQPGMWVNFYKASNGVESQPSEDEVKWLNAIRIGDLAQGDLSQLMAQSEFLINSIYEICRIPRNDGKNESGEAKKQREAGLIGRVNRCHISFGSAWEDLAALSWRIEAAHGTVRPPESAAWDSQWKPAEVRNDTEIVDNALKIEDKIDEETFLEIIASVYQFDKQKIALIMQRKAAEARARLSTMLPGFGGESIDNQTEVA